MFQMLLASILSILVPMVVLTATILLSARSMADREKLSPFECGFDPNHTARIPFSLRFFLLAIIFIVFDIEIVLLMPLPLILHTATCTQIAGGIIFLLILVIGLLHEWHQGSLNWSY